MTQIVPAQKLLFKDEVPHTKTFVEKTNASLLK
jgi:hypothetical protein